MTTELLRPGYSNILCTEDQCAFSGAVISTELEASFEKKGKVFLKRLQLLFSNYISTQREHSIPFKQLLVKEILVNGPWRFDFLRWSQSARYY